MAKNINYNLGKRIRELRTSKKMSQEDLALTAGITTAYLGSVERNIKSPTFRVLLCIVNSLNITLTEFFSDEVPEIKESDLISEKIENEISRFSNDHDKAIILDIIKSISKLNNQH